jgi:hypothetical protein
MVLVPWLAAKQLVMLVWRADVMRSSACFNTKEKQRHSVGNR